MNSHIERSTEIIKEYFELLKWRDNGSLSEQSLQEIEIKKSIQEIAKGIASKEKALEDSSRNYLEARKHVKAKSKRFIALLKEIDRQLFSTACLDIRNFCLEILGCFPESPILTSFICLFTFLITLFITVRFKILAYIVIILILCCLLIYLFIKITYVYKHRQLSYKKEIAQVQRLGKLVEAQEKKLVEVKNFHQQKLNELEQLQSQESTSYDSKLQYIQKLDEKVEQWLEDDKLYLIQRGMTKLKIQNNDNQEDQYQYNDELDFQPIVSLNGISSKKIFSDSYVLISDRDLPEFKKKNKDILIDENDFYKFKNLDDEYKYGVYEFVVIFLFENFLSYYRCFWDFIKRTPADEETSEYLYDSIVSVQTYEKYSLSTQNPDERRGYRDLLSITTKDGKIVYFNMSKDRKERINVRNSSSYVSDISQAAERIRYWLRQKRVDYVMIKRSDE